MYKSKLKFLANTNQALKNAKVCVYVTKVTIFHHFWPKTLARYFNHGYFEWRLFNGEEKEGESKRGE